MVIRRFETRLFHTSLAAILRGSTFYLADPVRSIRRFTQIFWRSDILFLNLRKSA